MELHWHHPEAFRAEDRKLAEERLRELAGDHPGLIDVRIRALTTRTRSDPGLALNETLDAFDREVWRVRHRRTQRRGEQLEPQSPGSRIDGEEVRP